MHQTWPHLLLASAIAFLLLGCGGKRADSSTRPAEMPEGVVENVIQAHWRGQPVKLGKLSYAPSVPSKGGRVPPGIKLYPIKARVAVGEEPEKEVLFYFYQTPFGSWEAYTE